jgi:heme exporter protein A
MKILSLLVKPTSGSLQINGEEVGERQLYFRRLIGVVSHQTFLYSHLTAFENLAFYGKMYQVSGLSERVIQVIEEVGLQYVLGDPVRTFSRGMQQRLAIARAILHSPQVLFLDEPYTGLDQQAMKVLDQVLLRLQSRQHTVILVTHSFEQGLTLCDQGVILVRGRLVHRAGREELLAPDFKQEYLRLAEGS